MALFDQSDTDADFDDNSNDQDFLFALQLQNQFNEEENHQKKLTQIPSMSVVDKRWELIDPNPNIYELFQQFNEQFFYSKLGSVYVEWSKRMTRCAGICSYRRGGECRIALSSSYLTLRPRKDLVETLLHEMIHAYLFVTHNNRDRDGHGPEFLKHMIRINDATGANITVYHSFHDEFDHLHGHWWRCTGKCREWKPFYGYVKRSMNRAPSNRDRWWAEHENRCGGKFEKVKEPENYKSKEKNSSKNLDQSTVKPKKRKVNETSNQNPIEKFFKKTNSTSSSNRTEQINAKEENSPTVNQSNYVQCPKCEVLLPKSNLFLHELRCQK